MLAVVVGLVGAVWILVDGRRHNIENADMWAVGFFVGVFIPPIIGAVVIGVLYIQNRDGGRRGTAAFEL